MRRLSLLLVLVVLIPAAGFAGWIFRFIPETYTVEVGQSIDATVYAGASGLSVTPRDYNWRFFSSDDRIAVIDGRLDAPSSKANVRITGMAPGNVFIDVRANGGSGPSSARVQVVCGQEPNVLAATPQVSMKFGETRALHAITPAESRTTFQWYRGHLGDTSQPLTSTGAELQFTAESSGAQFVWVSARTACAESAAEFRVDVAPAKVRSVRH